MVFTLNAAMFDLLILSVVAKEDTYGYQLSQSLKPVSSSKDSTLYPILRRLQENNFLKTYDQQYQGRNRKYYSITDAGAEQYRILLEEWNEYKSQIDAIVNGGITSE